MANSLQANKRIRQNEKSRLRNKSVKSEIKTLTKKFYSLIEDQDRVGAEAVFTDIISRLDKAAKNNLFHKNNVAKQKSSIAKSLGALKG